MTPRQKLKNISALKFAVLGMRQMRRPLSRGNIYQLWRAYHADWKQFCALSQNPHMPVAIGTLLPAIYDKTATTELDPTYFYQDAWCARKVAENKPTHHWDVASHVGMLSIIAQFVLVTMVDIRPVTLPLPGLEFVEGSVLALPFADNSIPSLSSICVIEHIGLGRYGDPLDPFGSEKAAAELTRVLAPGGDLYVTVPVDKENRVYFNAHRAFSREYILSLFPGLTLVEEKYIYGTEFGETYRPERGFGTGLYYFKKS